jgi:steroid delta-isomerase-like uncharacterized protein
MPGKFDARAYAQAWSSHSADRVLGFYAEDVEVIEPNSGHRYEGKEQLRRGIQAVFDAFPDIEGTPVEVADAGKKVALLFRIRGTNEGAYVREQGEPLPATGKRVEYALAVFLTLDEQGKIVRESNLMDMQSFLEQLGVAMPSTMEAEASA